MTPKAIKFTDGADPGYTRRRKGQGFIYLTSDGRPLRSAATIRRLDALALPPAYADAWYARDPQAHLQATGIDARGRKQYRYHPDFRASREDEKFARCSGFAEALPAIRKAVEKEMVRRTLSKERVVAAIVRLLDVGSIRVGNTAYARENRSFGATTLRNRHAKVQGKRVRLDYVGKSGKRQTIGLQDARLASIVRRCLDAPGQQLFQYESEDGGFHPVNSGDVNQWLCTVTGEHFTAKHFRTWTASVIAFEALVEAQGRTPLKPVMERVAARLGNTPAISRKSYVHPLVVEAISDPPDDMVWRLPRASKYLTPAERGLTLFLEKACRTDDAE